MEEKLNFTQLLQKPIAMMTGEELCFLITKRVENCSTQEMVRLKSRRLQMETCFVHLTEIRFWMHMEIKSYCHLIVWQRIW